jgi:transmembrane sensor
MDKLIVTYFQKRCTDEEKKALFNWIDTDPVNKNYFLQMRRLWDVNLVSFSSVSDLKDTKKAYQIVKQKLRESQGHHSQNKIRRIIFLTLRIAAVVLISFSLAWWFFAYREQRREIAWQTIEVPVGQRVFISMADGSKVWLNSKSHFSYPENFSHNKRIVTLDGEAYFEVAHDDKSPFEVKTKQVNVQVKGTKFNVYAYSTQPATETTLVEGVVSLSFVRKEVPAMLMKPDQKVIYNRGASEAKVVTHVDTNIETAWTKGIYYFNDISFEELVMRLEHYFDMKIIVNRKDILSYRCTGKFRYDETIRDILDVVKTSRPFRYQILERQITIY